jgi:DNA-binding transcriptional LysR family regulator
MYKEKVKKNNAAATCWLHLPITRMTVDQSCSSPDSHDGGKSWIRATHGSNKDIRLRPSRETYERVLYREGIHLNIVLELGSTEAIKQAVAAGLGVSVLSPLSIEWERKHKMLHAIRVTGGHFIREFHIISVHGRHLSPAAKRFLEVMKTFDTALSR